jgi:hypothetical protein
VEVAFTSRTGNTLAFKTRNSESGAVTTNLRFNQMVVSLDRLSDFNGAGLKSAKSLKSKTFSPGPMLTRQSGISPAWQSLFYQHHLSG